MREIRHILTFLVILLYYTEIGCVLDNETETCDASSSIHRPACDEAELIGFLADTQVINPESIVELAVDSLDPLCRNLCKHLSGLDQYLKKCHVLNDQALYISLIRGVKILRDKLCIDSEFYRRFQSHYHCLHELKNDFETCNAPADWNEETDQIQICKVEPSMLNIWYSFFCVLCIPPFLFWYSSTAEQILYLCCIMRDYKNMLDCYYVKAAKVCGISTARTIKELMKSVVNGVIQISCAGINQDPYVKDPMPPAYLKYDNMIDTNKAETVQLPSEVKVAMCLNILILYINQ